MNKLKSIIALILFTMTCSCATKEQQPGDEFHGTWRLDKFETYDAKTSQWANDTSRIGYTGYLLYDGQGHMGVHLTPRGYKDFNTNKNVDSLNNTDLKELIKFYQSNFVYFADVELAEGTISHKRLSATEPKNWGTTLTRDFEFRQDTLILTARESIAGMKLRLRWIKL